MSAPAKYRKRPVVVEAILFDGSNFGEVALFTGIATFGPVVPWEGVDDPDITAQVFDRLHSTWVGVKDGQWVIRGVVGEFYPCDADVFTATYEPVLEETT